MKVAIKLSRSTEIIDSEDILYLKAEGSYASIMKVNGESIKVSKNLLALSNLFKNYNSLQKCHRSYIVNVNYVKSVKTTGKQQYRLIMHNEDLIPLTLSKKIFIQFITEKLL